jgi:hypothetical protein
MWPKPPASFAATVLTAAMFLVAAGVVVGIATGSQSGTTAEWVSATSTAGALIAASFAAWYAAGAFGVERIREDRWQQEQRASQASLVAAWTRPTLRMVAAGELNVEAITGVTVWLRNASQVPVTQIEFELFHVRQVAPGRGGALLTSLVFKQHLDVLPPGDRPMELQITDPGVLDELSSSWSLDMPWAPELRIVLRFQDSAMRRWRRSTSGILSEEDLPQTTSGQRNRSPRRNGRS